MTAPTSTFTAILIVTGMVAAVLALIFDTNRRLSNALLAVGCVCVGVGALATVWWWGT